MIDIVNKKPLKYSPKNIRGPYSGCWLWAGAIQSNGYGNVWWDQKYQLVHRVVWSAFYGPIPNGMLVLHSCDVRSCFNPFHLFLGDYSSNMQDCLAKGRFTPVKFTEKDIKMMLSLREAGFSYPVIAQKMETKISSVYSALKRRGLVVKVGQGKRTDKGDV